MKQTCSVRACDEAVAAIEQEFGTHGTLEDREWFEYIKHGETSEQKCDQGVRDEGHGRVTLKSFEAKKQAKIARLNVAHVLALRLYAIPVRVIVRLHDACCCAGTRRPPSSP